jgi:hypothetical protein
MVTMDRQRFALFPTPDGGDVTVEVGGDCLPGIQPFAAAARETVFGSAVWWNLGQGLPRWLTPTL